MYGTVTYLMYCQNTGVGSSSSGGSNWQVVSAGALEFCSHAAILAAVSSLTSLPLGDLALE